MKDFQPGDLAYVPSDVSLIQYNDDGGVSNYFTTTEPQYVLILNSQFTSDRLYKYKNNNNKKHNNSLVIGH